MVTQDSMLPQPRGVKFTAEKHSQWRTNLRAIYHVFLHTLWPPRLLIKLLSCEGRLAHTFGFSTRRRRRRWKQGYFLRFLIFWWTDLIYLMRMSKSMVLNVCVVLVVLLLSHRFVGLRKAKVCLWFPRTKLVHYLSSSIRDRRRMSFPLSVRRAQLVSKEARKKHLH